MLENYKDVQPVAYQILKNEIDNNKYSHAYIIEANNYQDAMGFAKSLAKTLFCMSSSNKEHIISQVDSDNFPELKIINPDGLVIKKEEIEELQVEFSKKPLFSDKKIYIINNAERLNGASANSLLKFLEEPNQDIVAILVTNNVYEMLETIISRCQIVNLKEEKIDLSEKDLYERIILSLNKKEDDLKKVFENENLNDIIYKCVDFINYYEKHKMDTFIYVNKLWFDFYKTKEQFAIAFKIMLLYYTDAVRLACKAKLNIFYEYESDIKDIVQNCDVNNLCKKVKILMDLEIKVKANNNLNLIMDKLLIELGRCDGYV